LHKNDGHQNSLPDSAPQEKNKTTACSRCSYELETTTHILQCPQPSSQLQWDSDIHNFRLALKELETHPDILEDISSGINAWRLQINPPPMLTQAGQHQMNLSWNNFMHRFVHRSWRTAQIQYYKQKHYYKP